MKHIYKIICKSLKYFFRGEDFDSFHFTHIRQNSPALWRLRFSTNPQKLIEGHPRNISTNLFENQQTDLGREKLKIENSVTMKSRILHGSKEIEGNS